jgi:hypothetical protein
LQHSALTTTLPRAPYMRVGGNIKVDLREIPRGAMVMILWGKIVYYCGLKRNYLVATYERLVWSKGGMQTGREKSKFGRNLPQYQHINENATETSLVLNSGILGKKQANEVWTIARPLHNLHI